MSGNEAPTSAGPTEEFSLRRHVWRRVLGEWSPFISLIILGGLVLIAVAAPLLASDRPILMYRAGELSMPFLKTNRWRVSCKCHRLDHNLSGSSLRLHPVYISEPYQIQPGV